MDPILSSDDRRPAQGRIPGIEARTAAFARAGLVEEAGP